MKRDTSRIFTVPEEVELDATHYSQNHCVPPLHHNTAYNSPVKRKQQQQKQQNEESNNFKPERPKYQQPLTPSVCSTPLKDVNRVLHGFAVSIVAGGEETDVKQPLDNRQINLIDKENETNNQTNVENKSSIQSQNQDDIPEVVKEALRYKRLNKLRNAPTKEKLLQKAKNRNNISLSLNDIEDTTKQSNEIVIKTYKLETIKKQTSHLDEDYDSSKLQRRRRRRFYNTISDPFYPVFRNDGLPISQSLYVERIADHYQELNQTTRIVDLADEILKNSKLPVQNEKTKNDDRCQKLKPNLSLDVRLQDNKNKQESYRRSMSLPLKPINAFDNEDRRKSTSECAGIFDQPQRRKLDGLQLTPLMSKLSLLADERTSGFCSRETTPSEYRDISTYSMVKNKLENASKEGYSDNDDEIEDDWTTTTIANKDECNYEKGELFICGHQNMVLFLLMEDGIANDPELIHTFVSTSLIKRSLRVFICLI